ncbi:MAG: porphobilinogen synthase [Lentisphaeria bacterium]|nr:porphobilinogen synthase [Candidatus Neomarinimicrobiota bacterium]MCF7842766.1 porphobilinogen synthase [Lentisphaeria bacterium]
MDLDHRHLIYRPRRLRRNTNIRGLVRENHVTPNDLVMPVFITAGKNKKHKIPSMPGIYQWSLDKVGHHIADLMNAGITRVILFGIPSEKDATGSDAIDDDKGIIQQSIRFLRKHFPELYIITDICMCEYTDHGHCGIIHENDVHNDTTLTYLQKQVVSHARAGVDMVAPSGMMDGMVDAIRMALDENDFEQIPIMSYAVKYASAYYGPFREAAESAPQFGDRQAYQMDPANVREALKEAELDIAEGADILMVKPALAYLDVIARVREMTSLPIACYNVSGEYSMIKAAAAKGWIDGTKVMLETLTAMKRAGADIILTYFALEAAKYL